MARGKYSKSDVSRERILDAATELFSTRGYAGAGVDRLAERSGIAKTAIYYHFGNKEGLLAAVLERAAGQWIEGIEQAARQAGADPMERLDRALAGMRAMLEERPWIYNLFQILALEMAEEKPAIRATLTKILARARQAIVTGLNDAMGFELPRAEGLATMLLATLDGISLGMQVHDDEISLDEVFLELRRVVAFMVATRMRPELAQLFDDPPEALRTPAARAMKGGGDERSGQSDG